ncbi:hypothetical protein SAMD00020551_3996 [Mesobacillus selenatarsenatis SF-1]|uniref:Uncharacterized protein n=1 Tax=Mesobacillus selenatarsenatis (strain DSM 18680 / JCM 14380 / FERM P-15431 / SF-1) TaxID=1321606 RepID=A0A0A8X7E5_MESS1|nr:hypothetical protein SAMD00020551_3996 [Mesobacillus selenatarsenatis SF-1]
MAAVFDSNQYQKKSSILKKAVLQISSTFILSIILFLVFRHNEYKDDIFVKE